MPPLSLSAYVTPIALLAASNVFMTVAWYWHLKFHDRSLWSVILISWGIAFLEYCIAVPANRWGYGTYSPYELKTIQEVVTLVIFMIFSWAYLGAPPSWNHLLGFSFICLGAFFIFHRW
jgi:uncharacterized protein (DUF486 family)